MAMAQAIRRSIPKPEKLRAMLFDIDGTLCDSDPMHYLSFRELLQSIGYQGGVPISRDYFNAHISGKHNPEIASFLFPDWDEEKRNRFMEDKEQHFRDIALMQLKPLPGLPRLCKWVEERKLRRVAVTNAPKANAIAMIKRLGMESFFEGVIIGSECERPKPFPDPYLKALSFLSVPAENALVFEDSVSGISSAVAAGIAVVGLTTGNPASALLEAGASLLAKDYDDPVIWEALEEPVAGPVASL